MNVYTITGATGYIGGKLLEYLSKQDDTYIYAIIRETSKINLERKNIEYIVFDGKEKSLEMPIKQSQYLIHLGALYTTSTTEVDLVDLVNSNILFSSLLFNVANKVNREIVITNASTFSFLDEFGNYSPSTFYSATKKAVEDIAYFYKELSIHFLTFPDTYGENDYRPKIHNILSRNKTWPFKFRSKGEQEIRLLHVDDIIGFLLTSLKIKDKGVHIHDIYTEGHLLTLKELSEKITDKECEFTENAELTRIPKYPREISTPLDYEIKHKKVEFKK